MDAEHVGDLAAPVLSLAAWHTLVVRVAQGGDELTLELAHGLGVNAVVDGLVRHASLMALGVDVGQCQGNLLGRPALIQKMAHNFKEHTCAMELLCWSALLAPLQGAGARWCAGVACRVPVALQFSADGAG